MKKILFVAIAFCAMTLSLEAAERYYTNPIVPGFNPDPSICRVGDDFYMATSTFEYFPGVPIYHSKDLVNWEIVGHALHRPSQLDLDNAKCSGGIYAPTLRYHNGTFYMITTLVGRGAGKPGNFVVTATNPAGPWSDPYWIENAPGIDPSLFFDEDGRVYYTGNMSPKNMVWEKQRTIWVQEIDPKTFQLKGDKIQVVDGAEYYKQGTYDGGIESGMNNYEGPHIYKKNGLYYLLVSHGGTSENHAVSFWVSENVFGPYRMNKKNPVLTHRDLSHNFAFTSTGHADFVDTPNGEWWVVYLAKRPNEGKTHIMGRETFMSPVKWDGEFPVVNPDGYVGKGELVHKAPNLKEYKANGFPERDNFDAATLRPEWTFIRTPRSEWWSLTAKSGSLRVQLRPERINEQVNPSFVGIRQQHYHFSAALKMDFKAKGNNEEAGFVIERDMDNYFRFTVGQSSAGDVLRLAKKSADTEDTVIKEIALKSVPYLKVSVDGVYYTFSYSFDGKKWQTFADRVDGKLLGMPGSGRFTGTFLGLYASSNGKTSDNFVDFDWFEYLPAK